MSREHAHLNTALSIVNSYQGDIPLSVWLKNYFREHKKHGSRDRKNIAHLCFAWYRLGRGFEGLSYEERMLTAVLLCEPVAGFLLSQLRPEWNRLQNLSLEEKLEILDAEKEWERLFPYTSELSSAVAGRDFSLSMLIQPDLFLRVRPGRMDIVTQQLKEAEIPFHKERESALRLENQSKIDTWLQIDRDVVVQDLSSQQVLEPLLQENTGTLKTLWDCCAASGGKTLLAADLIKLKNITVSDIRGSILHNLRSRFARAGLKDYRVFQLDLTREEPPFADHFDLVVCDAPCSGSGTWARTPEQLHYFRRERIDHYATLQKEISKAASRRVQQGGYFLYITCSVFKAENEDVVDFISSNTQLTLLSSGYHEGKDKKADTLFTALFRL